MSSIAITTIPADMQCCHNEHVQTKRSVLSLERCIDRLKSTHADTLRSLHQEVQRLQSLCTELTLQISRQECDESHTRHRIVKEEEEESSIILLPKESTNSVEEQQQLVVQLQEMLRLRDIDLFCLQQKLDARNHNVSTVIDTNTVDHVHCISQGHTRLSTPDSIISFSGTDSLDNNQTSRTTVSGNTIHHVPRPPSAPPTLVGLGKRHFRNSRSSISTPSSCLTNSAMAVSPPAEQNYERRKSARDPISSIHDDHTKPTYIRRSVSVFAGQSKVIDPHLDFVVSSSSTTSSLSKYDLTRVPVLPPISPPVGQVDHCDKS